MPIINTGTITTGTGTVQASVKQGEDSFIIRISGTYAGFAGITEVSVDGTTWHPALHTRLDTVSVSSTTVMAATNASAALVVSSSSVNFVRLRATNLTSGTVNVVLSSSEDSALSASMGANSDGVLVDLSAARTVNANGVTFNNFNGTALIVYINVTAFSGTTPNLVARLQQTFDGVTWTDVDTTNLQTAVIAGTGLSRLEWGPGTPTVANTSKQGHTPRLVRLAWTITGTTPSFTFTSHYHAVN